MAGHKMAHAVLKGPSVVKEICIGLTLGLMAGGLWKMHHWNEQRRTRTFYSLLEKGEISVVASEEDIDALWGGAKPSSAPLVALPLILGRETSVSPAPTCNLAETSVSSARSGHDQLVMSCVDQ
ncbi:hypothetical protein LUZ63_011578 [Rhynchospora breviuscula]|uniref:Cytochrome c oxidase subunit 5C n=1 Tax=Rhynchospora breviuscula TaxID=2022672 RepID=A0A9Q0CJF2_9POAL|nr:hypothetical protein LUZ63_011578 [Rhynchospora breviuscula]